MTRDEIDKLLSLLGYSDQYIHGLKDMPVNPFTVSAKMPALPGETQGQYERRYKRFLSPSMWDRVMRWIRGS